MKIEKPRRKSSSTLGEMLQLHGFPLACALHMYYSSICFVSFVKIYIQYRVAVGFNTHQSVNNTYLYLARSFTIYLNFGNGKVK